MQINIYQEDQRRKNIMDLHINSLNLQNQQHPRYTLKEDSRIINSDGKTIFS